MSQPLEGLPGGVPLVGQQKVEPMAVIVDGPGGKKILLQCVAMHLMSEEALDAVADRVAAKLMPQIEALFAPAATSG